MFPTITDVPESYCELEKFFRFTHQVSHALYEVVKNRHKSYEFPSDMREKLAQAAEVDQADVVNAVAVLDAAEDIRDLWRNYTNLHSAPELERLRLTFRSFESNPGKYHLEAGEAMVLREFHTACLQHFVAPVPVFVPLSKAVPADVEANDHQAQKITSWVEDFYDKTMSLPDHGHAWFREIFHWLSELRVILHTQVISADLALQKQGVHRSVTLLDELLLFEEVLDENLHRQLVALRHFLQRWLNDLGVPCPPLMPREKFEGGEYREIETRYQWSRLQTAPNRAKPGAKKVVAKKAVAKKV